MPVASLRLCTSFWRSRPVALILVEHSATATPAQYAPTSPELNTLPMRLLGKDLRACRQGEVSKPLESAILRGTHKSVKSRCWFWSLRDGYYKLCSEACGLSGCTISYSNFEYPTLAIAACAGARPIRQSLRYVTS
jgi:hypothetical protein